MADWFITQLLNRGRPWDAIETMSLALFDNDDPWRPTTDQVLAAMLLAMTPDVSDGPYGETSSHAIGQLLEFLTGAEVDDLTLVRLELVFRRILGPLRPPTVLDRILADDPEIYAELVDLAHGEPPDERSLWLPARLALADWRTLPGRRADGGLDRERLHDWVRRARALLADSGPLTEHSEYIIGRMLSGSPDGTDGAWPAEPVRELLDERGAEQLTAGFFGTRPGTRPGARPEARSVERDRESGA